MKGILSSTKALFPLYLCTTLINAALIPSPWHPTAATLFKRAVVYGDPGNRAETKSAICNDDQKKVLEQSMGEAAKLAKAGSDGLTMILDMLGEKKEYDKLETPEKNRYKETYFTFFGRVNKKEKIPAAQERVKFIKDRLDRMKDLTKESWPEQITFFCDSTYYQEKDDDGKKWDEVEPPKDAPAKANQRWVYDTHKAIWSEVTQASDCSTGQGDLAGFTARLEAINNGGKGKPSDRITWCPKWFEVIKGDDAGKSFTDLDPKTDIKVGTMMKDFARKSARLFLHEHLHTYFVNQEMDKDKLLGDKDGVPGSYGATNAKRLAESDATLEKANKNIENVVYWCIAMFYDMWAWQTVTADDVK